MPSVGRYGSTIFFPDESGGANPFGSLAHAIGRPLSAPSVPTARRTRTRRSAQVLQAEEVVGQHLPLTRVDGGPRLAVRGPMRELMDSLMAPGTMEDFLAQREVVRRRRR